MLFNSSVLMEIPSWFITLYTHWYKARFPSRLSFPTELIEVMESLAMMLDDVPGLRSRKGIYEHTDWVVDNLETFNKEVSDLDDLLSGRVQPTIDSSGEYIQTIRKVMFKISTPED